MLQAQIFVALLDEELTDLRLQLATAGRRVRADKQGADKQLDLLETRIAEVLRLLHALALNFPTA